MDNNKPIPPKLAQRILLRFMRDDLAEEVLGDLDEKFYVTLKNKPLFRARLNYWYQVLNYVRPFAFRKSNSPTTSNPLTMLRHNFILTFRNFKRYKSSFFINLIGLSTGLAAVLLIYLWVYDELSFDKFHENDNRLYQVMRNYVEVGIHTSENNSALLAPALAEEMPEIEYVVPIRGPFSDGILSAGEKNIKATGKFAGRNFFNVFSYRLIQGDINQVLHEKYAMVISDELAIKLFGTTENIAGKGIKLNHEWFGGEHIISGVFEKSKYNSSEQFDFLLNQELFLEKSPMHWQNNSVSVYLTLRKNADVNHFKDKIRDFIKSKYIALYGSEDPNLRYVGSLFIQHYSDKYLYNRYENGVQAGGRIEYVKLFSIIALFILSIACINFMNLSTARASRRIKEIGIKKTIGANRKELVFQYLGESMLMTLLSLIVAILLVALLLPRFNEITGKHLGLNFDINLMLSALGIALTTGFISGSYPALYLSGFRPAVVLKGKLNTSMAESWTRKGLVVFQFGISVILIVSVLVVHKQIELIQTKNLGYNKDNIIHFANDGNLKQNMEPFLTELKNIPGVVNASSMHGDMVGNQSGGSGIQWEGQSPGHEIDFSGLYVDYDMIETLGLKMVEGRPFSRKFGSDNSSVIFNEAAIAAMGIKDPIGKTARLWGKDKQIIGVVKDFHFKSLYEKVTPFFLSYSQNNSNVLVKIKTGMESEVLSKIQQAYQSFNEGLSFEYKFLDDDYQLLYASEQRVAVLSKYFAGIAILISCLGLFGLAAFTAERRLKEIGIRKVLGSSEFGIIRLLSGDFTRMVFIAIIIALPVSFIIARSWLDGFAYRIDLEWWFFTGAGLVALLVAWFTVGLQTVKAARINPAHCLKNE